jgi:hypothetical protein
MWQNKVDRGGAKHKVRWHFPEHDEVCQNCWARTAGFYDKKTSDVNRTFRTLRSTQAVILLDRGSLVLGSLVLGRGLQCLANSGTHTAIVHTHPFQLSRVRFFNDYMVAFLTQGGRESRLTR